MAIGRLDLPALVLDLAKQPRVLNRQGGLRRKRLKKIDDFRRKAARLLPLDRQSTQNSLFAEQWNCQNRSVSMPRGNRPKSCGPEFPFFQ